MLLASHNKCPPTITSRSILKGTQLNPMQDWRLKTIAYELGKMYPEFDCLHIFLGKSINVNPPLLGIIGLPNQESFYHSNGDHDPTDNFLADNPLEDKEAIEKIHLMANVGLV